MIPVRSPILLLVALVLQVSVAEAVQVGPTTRVDEDAHDLPDVLSRADCISDNDYLFDLTGITIGNPIEVWGSQETTCTSEQRADDICVRITEETTYQQAGVEDYTVSAKAIVAALLGEATCTDAATGATTERNFNLFFFENLGGDMSATPQTVNLKVDLKGPRPPTNVTVGVGSESSIQVSYDASPDTSEVRRYRVYCDPPPEASTGEGGAGTTTNGSGGAQADFHPHAVGGAGGTGGNGVGGLNGSGPGGSGPGGGGPGGSGPGGGGLGGSGPGGGGSGGGGGLNPSGAGGAGGASVGAGGAGVGGAAPVDCESDLLEPGQLPPEGLVSCGEGQGAELDANGLVLGQRYAVAVAAIDQVGNDGALSELACGETESTIDFFEGYRAAGGQAGGGFCNCGLIGADPRSRWGLYLALAGGIVLGMRRRRRVG